MNPSHTAHESSRWESVPASSRSDGFADAQFDDEWLGFDDHPFLLPTRRPGMDGADLGLAQAFRDAFGRHPAGAGIITGNRPEGPVGILVSSLASVSAVPAVVSFSVSDSSNAGQSLLQCSRVAVHLLTPQDEDAAMLFSRRGTARSTEELWRIEEGLPMLRTHGPVLVGRIGVRVRAGAATLVTVDLDRALPGEPADDGLVYFNRGWHVVGSPAS